MVSRRNVLRVGGGVVVCLAGMPRWGAGAAGDVYQEAIDRAHAEVWRRFVDQHNVILDYADLDGSIIRPTPEDCRECKPSALSWGVPNEDGAFFNGIYLDTLCVRWRVTREEAIRAKARRMVEGLLVLASVGKTPGFIARGVATDGKTTYPMGSNDQTMPWLYGIWRYLQDGLAEGEERAALVKRFTQIVEILEKHEWRMPCDGGPAPYRGSIARHTWESAPRLLFVLKAMHVLTGDARWNEKYRAAARETGGKNNRSRLDFCRAGMVFFPGEGRHTWTGSIGMACLRALWEMETEAELRGIYAEGLKASARLAAEGLELGLKFAPKPTDRFEHDWRVMNGAWKPQHSEAEAVAVALAGLKLQHAAGSLMEQEKDLVREPCFAAWAITLCPEKAVIETHRAAILRLIRHFRYERLYLSQFFPIEGAWYRMKEVEG